LGQVSLGGARVDIAAVAPDGTSDVSFITWKCVRFFTRAARPPWLSRRVGKARGAPAAATLRREARGDSARACGAIYELGRGPIPKLRRHCKTRTWRFCRC